MDDNLFPSFPRRRESIPRVIPGHDWESRKSWIPDQVEDDERGVGDDGGRVGDDGPLHYPTATRTDPRL